MSATSLGKIQFKDLKLTIRKMKVAEEFSKSIQSNLSREQALYPITQSRIRTFLIQSGTTTTTLQNVLSGSLPQSLLIGFLSAKSSMEMSRLIHSYSNISI